VDMDIAAPALPEQPFGAELPSVSPMAAALLEEQSPFAALPADDA
jgi:hypothetical protein